jgi:CRP-like cAMP-binding protein
MNHIAHAEIDRTPPKHDAAWTIGIAARPAQHAPVAGAREASFADRETLCEEGARADQIFIVAQGAVMLSKLLPDGRRQIIELLGAGDVFGLTNTVLYDTTADALTPVRAFLYERRFFEASPELQRAVSQRMMSQICAMHDHAMLLGRKTAAERVASFLMGLIPNRGGHGCQGSDAKVDTSHITIPMTRQEIADYLGLTLETVSRAFSQLKKDGILKALRHNEIVVTNVCRLCHLTGSSDA